MRRIELLSPAKDLAIGIAAVDHGADAVYIGAPAFGARKAAANSIEDIAELVKYAHRYYCRVFVTFNTVLYDHELAEAEKIIRRLYEIGVDALIIQDMGILRMNLPPICLHASTQMHNYELERIKFLDQIGFQRIVLARELSLEQIRTIRQAVKAELEVFIHGALCVSLSGQCYLSQYMFGRSANRGGCAQPCRMKWSVKDSAGKIIIDEKYALSLKDLNLSSYIDDLIDAGVDSFKIEGRLKDENYVSNVTHYYSSLIDQHPGIIRIGSGKIISAFTPEPERSFNRGSSSYFFNGREKGLINPDTPKSMGKYIGRVLQCKGNQLCLQMIEPIHNGDGLCYLEKGDLKGIKVNQADGNRIICNEAVKIAAGTELFRNYDRCFVMQLEKVRSIRKIGIKLNVVAKGGCLSIRAVSADGVSVTWHSAEVFEKANNPVQEERLKQQLMKCGDTVYTCEEVTYEGEALFVPAVVANQMRRQLLEQLDLLREESRKMMQPVVENREVKYTLLPDWHLNVVNRKAAAFYKEHGVSDIEKGFEKRENKQIRDLMHTRYCILYELGRCRKQSKNEDLTFPLYLFNHKHQFQLEFDCKACFMKVMKEC